MHVASLQQKYEEGLEPIVGHSIPVYVDEKDPSDVKMKLLMTPKTRTMVRIISGIVGVVSIIVVIVNIILVNNNNFRTLQGGLGTIGAIGAAF